MCRLLDPLIFFPDEKNRALVQRAANFCKTCPVQWDCAHWGLYESAGIWGGLTTSKRVKLRRVGGPAYHCACGSLNTWVHRDGIARCGDCKTEKPG